MLVARGWKTLRIPSKMVLDDLQKAKELILAFINH